MPPPVEFRRPPKVARVYLADSHGQALGGAATAPPLAASAAREPLERIPGEPVRGPLIERDGSQAPVEPDRGLVPVEHRPLEPRASALESRARQPCEQALADAEPARFGSHVEVLEVDAGLADEGRE